MEEAVSVSPSCDPGCPAEERQGVVSLTGWGEGAHLALHVLGLLGCHVRGRLKVQHGLSSLFLILLLVLHLEMATRTQS